MDKDIYSKHFDGFEVRHASILKKNMIVFVAQESVPVEQEYVPPEELPTRLITYLPDIKQEEEEGFGHVEFKYGVKRGYIIIDQNLVFVESTGNAWESKTNGQWHKIVADTDVSRFLFGIRKIGNSIFACGSERKVYRRLGHEKWVNLVDEEKHGYVYTDIIEREKRKLSLIGYPIGHRCVNGFHEEDLYAGGSKGDFWHYDGDLWRRIDLQTNRNIVDIVCAEQFVYVCLHNGQIFKGRGDQWTAIENEVDGGYTFAADVRSAAWFQGKLYLSTPLNLYVLEDTKLIKYKFPEDGPKQSSFANVTACDEALLSYGNYQAMVFDGQSWTEIVNRPLFSQSKTT